MYRHEQKFRAINWEIGNTIYFPVQSYVCVSVTKPVVITPLVAVNITSANYAFFHPFDIPRSYGMFKSVRSTLDCVLNSGL